MFLSESRASCASRVHVKWSDFFIMSLYSGRLRSPSRAMRHLRAARQPVTEDHVWFEDRWMVASLCDE
jgi:hypothetical protein